MKFHRNKKEAKIFRCVALASLTLPAVSIVIFFITKNKDLLSLFLTSALVPPCFFFIAHHLKNNYIEFQNKKIVFINFIAPSVEVPISEIEVILIPSPQALKNKAKDNAVIFKRPSVTNITSYSPEIEKYILDYVDAQIVYYDDYSAAINNTN
jgi:hypothetical protein